MPNYFKYKKQDLTEPPEVVGQRLSTNAYYTGHKKGTQLQDAKGKNVPYEVEDSHVHVGTIIQDATPGSMPERVIEPPLAP